MSPERATAIVIVNYRTADLVIDCLKSLEAEMQAEPASHVYIGDNASPDDSVERLTAFVRDAGYAWVTVRKLEKNGGFAYGNNQLIEPLLEADSPYRFFYLLNPDTIVRPQALTTLIDAMLSHPEAGIIGGGLDDLASVPQCAAYQFHGIASEFERGMRFGPITKLLKRWMVAPPPSAEPHACDWTSGASMIVRREVFERIGLMDEGYFLYFEETDFCKRTAKAGFAIRHEPRSHIVHLEGQSTGVKGTQPQKKRMPDYWFASRRRYFRKHHGRVYEFLANTAFLSAYTTWRIRRWIQRKPDPDPPGLWGDFLRKALLGLRANEPRTK